MRLNMRPKDGIWNPGEFGYPHSSIWTRKRFLSDVFRELRLKICTVWYKEPFEGSICSMSASTRWMPERVSCGSRDGDSCKANVQD